MSRVERVFLAIDCDVETRAAQIAQLESAFPGRSMPGRPTPPANWHITLRWLGDVDEVSLDRLVAELDQVDLCPRFRLRLTDLGMFPHPERAGVLWRAVEDGGGGLVSALNQSVEDACEAVGLGVEERPYIPHLTLSRLRPQADLAHLLAVDLRPLRMPVTAITVFQSVPGGSGNPYEVLERLDLRR